MVQYKYIKNMKMFKKGDFAKITDGPFKDFDCRVLIMTPKKGGMLVEIEMFKRKVKIHLDELQIKKIIAKCFKCEEVLDIKWEELKWLSWEGKKCYWTCSKCLKEYRKFEKEHDKLPYIGNMERWIARYEKIMNKYDFIRTPKVPPSPRTLKELKKIVAIHKKNLNKSRTNNKH